MSLKNRPCFTFSIDGACPEITLDVFNIDNGVVKAKWVKFTEPLQWCMGTVRFATSMLLTLLSVAHKLNFVTWPHPFNCRWWVRPWSFQRVICRSAKTEGKMRVLVSASADRSVAQRGKSLSVAKRDGIQEISSFCFRSLTSDTQEMCVLNPTDRSPQTKFCDLATSVQLADGGLGHGLFNEHEEVNITTMPSPVVPN